MISASTYFFCFEKYVIMATPPLGVRSGIRCHTSNKFFSSCLSLQYRNTASQTLRLLFTCPSSPCKNLRASDTVLDLATALNASLSRPTAICAWANHRAVGRRPLETRARCLHHSLKTLDMVMNCVYVVSKNHFINPSTKCTIIDKTLKTNVNLGLLDRNERMDTIRSTDE